MRTKRGTQSKRKVKSKNHISFLPFIPSLLHFLQNPKIMKLILKAINKKHMYLSVFNSFPCGLDLGLEVLDVLHGLGALLGDINEFETCRI